LDKIEGILQYYTFTSFANDKSQPVSYVNFLLRYIYVLYSYVLSLLSWPYYSAPCTYIVRVCIYLIFFRSRDSRRRMRNEKINKSTAHKIFVGRISSNDTHTHTRTPTVYPRLHRTAHPDTSVIYHPLSSGCTPSDDRRNMFSGKSADPLWNNIMYRRPNTRAVHVFIYRYLPIMHNNICLPILYTRECAL